MRKTKNKNRITTIAIERLVPHPDSPNRMSKGNFVKLVRNIERTGRYEPLVVRPKDDGFQIVNGYHRWRALMELGCKSVEAVVWDIDDEETDVLLATLNRLGGTNVLNKKLALLRRLNQRTEARDLAKRLPLTAKQIERFAQMSAGFLKPNPSAEKAIAHPLVFFLDDVQNEILEKAMSRAHEGRNEKTKAARNAAALTHIARTFVERHKRCANVGNSQLHTSLKARLV